MTIGELKELLKSAEYWVEDDCKVIIKTESGNKTLEEIGIDFTDGPYEMVFKLVEQKK